MQTFHLPNLGKAVLSMVEDPTHVSNRQVHLRYTSAVTAFPAVDLTSHLSDPITKIVAQTPEEHETLFKSLDATWVALVCGALEKTIADTAETLKTSAPDTT